MQEELKTLQRLGCKGIKYDGKEVCLLFSDISNDQRFRSYFGDLTLHFEEILLAELIEGNTASMSFEKIIKEIKEKGYKPFLMLFQGLKRENIVEE